MASQLTEDSEFAEAIRQRREELGLAQSALAARLASDEWSPPQQVIGLIEAGKRRVSVGEAHRIAGALETSIETLILGEMSADASVRTLALALDRVAGIAESNDVRRAIWHTLGSSVALDNIDHEAWTDGDNS